MKLTKVTKISILNGLFLLLLTLIEFFGLVKFQLLFSYNTHKLLHLIGVMLFMGNMTIGPIWFSFAYYSKSKELLNFANKLLQITDIYVTIPSIALTVINGLCLASVFGGTKNQTWLYYSVLSLFFMWFLSIPLIYLQEKLYTTIELEPDNEIKIKQYLYYWGILGTIVMIPPSIIFYLMVIKG